MMIVKTFIVWMLVEHACDYGEAYSACQKDDDYIFQGA